MKTLHFSYLSGRTAEKSPANTAHLLNQFSHTSVKSRKLQLFQLFSPNAMDEITETSNSLLQRVQNGDETSWTRFAFIYSPLVVRWCKANGIPDAECDDIKQEIFKSIFRKIASFNRLERYSFRGWLKTICLNQCRDYHRKHGPVTELTEAILDQNATAAGNVDSDSFLEHNFDSVGIDEEKNELLKQVFKLIRSEFSERDVNVFSDLVGHEISVASVSEKYGISKNNVYKIKCKFLARAKSEFHDSMGSDWLKND